MLLQMTRMDTSCLVIGSLPHRKRICLRVSYPTVNCIPLTFTPVGFYTELGSRRLSLLIREDYKTSSEIKISKIASDTRSLILERLPLFLHEHTHSRAQISYSWLTDEKNFAVKAYGKLTITKSLNFGDLRLSRSQDASAASRRLGRGPIELWLAGHSQVDMYE